MKRARLTIGSSVVVNLDDGTQARGQVWSLADVHNYVWVALDGGRYVAVYTPRGQVKDCPGGEQVGQVAA